MYISYIYIYICIYVCMYVCMYVSYISIYRNLNKKRVLIVDTIFKDIDVFPCL